MCIDSRLSYSWVVFLHSMTFELSAMGSRPYKSAPFIEMRRYHHYQSMRQKWYQWKHKGHRRTVVAAGRGM
jgi:hypothetical protein